MDSLRPLWEPNDIIKMFHEERAKIELRGRECRNLLDETSSVLAEAQTLQNLYTFISPKTSQLHSECKTLIQERNDLRESYDKINYTLNKQEELRGILKRMPEIKNQVFSILKSVGQRFQTVVTGSASSDLIPLEDYYGRFFVECRRIKDLTAQLESCLTCANTDELAFYLEEIYKLYMDIREQLIGPVFSKNLDRLVERANRNYCDLIQQSCASLIRTMRNEIQLFQQVFPTPRLETSSTEPHATQDTRDKSDESAKSSNGAGDTKKPDAPRETDVVKGQALRELLEMLCRVFYEHFRPIIIHVNHLETLAELHKLLNETIRLEFQDESFQSTINNLIEDIQERLIFRTEIFIQENILDYKPSHGDLAYPEKFDLIPGGDLYDYQSMWYPTVQRAVLAMLYLKRVFDDLTFSELAQEIVAACYKSLDMAQHLVDERHGGSKVEASLFLSKHTAIIVNQLRIFGLDQSTLVPPIPLMASESADGNSARSSDAS